MNDATYREYLAQYNGCDGGNPQAAMWICGIEPGLSKQEHKNKEFLLKVDAFDFEKYNDIIVPYRGKKFFNKYKDVYAKWKFDQIVAKILCLIDGNPIECYTAYMRKLYSKDGECFKINLYPLKKLKAKNWDVEEYKEFFDDIKSFWKWCEENRFSFFKEQIKKYSSRPKIIVCTGLSFKDEFIKAFAPSACTTTLARNNISPFFVLSGNTVNSNCSIKKMYITPFFNYRWMSHDRIRSLAKYIKQDFSE